MTMHNYAEHSQFGDLIKKMRDGEVNGSELYFVLIYLAREKGYHDLAEAGSRRAGRWSKPTRWRTTPARAS